MTFRTVSILNLIALVLLGSWIWPETGLYWQWADDAIFHYGNRLITPEHPVWVTVLSWASVRVFDMVIFAFMSLLLVGCALSERRQPHWQAKWLRCVILMGSVAGLGGFIIHTCIAYGHPSPTLVYPEAHLLSQLTALPVKDQATNSFPGDHGFMAMVFACVMLYFAPRAGKWLSVLLAFAITLPRIMVGAHWFSDVYMGSLAIILLMGPWALYISANIGTLRHSGRAG